MTNRSLLFNYTLRPVRFLLRLLSCVPCSYFYKIHVKWRVLHTTVMMMLIIVLYLQRIGLIALLPQRRVVFESFEITIKSTDALGGSIIMMLHLIVQVEHTWKNHIYEIILENLEDIFNNLKDNFNINLNVKHLKIYCICSYFVYFCFVLIIVPFTCIALQNDVLAFSYEYAMYSDLVEKLLLLEFIIFAKVVNFLHEKLNFAVQQVVLDLELARCANWKTQYQHLTNLSSLQQIYSNLWRTLRYIEQYFNWALPGVLLTLFVDLMILCNSLCTSLFKLTFDMTVVYCLTLSILITIALITVFFVCNNIENACQHLAEILHNAKYDRRNPYMVKSFRLLSLHLMQQPMRISAGGFIYVNNNMLAGFLFSVIAYIVISTKLNLPI